MVGALSMSILALRRLSMWKQDRPAGFADRIASRLSLPDASDPNLHQYCYYYSHHHHKDINSPSQEESDLGVSPKMEEDESLRCFCGDFESVGIGTILDSDHEPTGTVPSLSSGSASSVSASSSLSLDAIWASGIVGNDILEDDGTGALVVPPNHSLQHLLPPPPAPTPPPLPNEDEDIYACLFHILDCQDTFDDAELWKTHVLSHFRTHEPPDTARCPLCTGERFHSTPHHRAWDLLLEHVDVAHYQQGETLAGSRPDFELMQYLFRLRVISVDQFKVMQLPPPPSSPAYHRSQEPVRANIGSSDEPYCAPYSRRREERMRGQRRGVSVA